jgi:hypothetical protein
MMIECARAVMRSTASTEPAPDPDLHAGRRRAEGVGDRAIVDLSPSPKGVDCDVAHLGQAAPVEHLGDRLPDFEHQMSDLACGLVAIFTALVPVRPA